MKIWIVRLRGRGFVDHGGNFTRTRRWAQRFSEQGARTLAAAICHVGRYYAWAEPLEKTTEG